MSEVMQQPITTFNALPDSERTRDLLQSFKKQYDCDAEYVARAPGRVSIIGEHIDYAGLSVMPAAIDRNILMACTAESSSGGESRITVSNVNPRFTTEEVVYKPGKTGPQLDQKAHTWVNYFKAGLKGVLLHLSDETAAKSISLKIMVDGNVPPAGGLSSSAAMVVASAIAVINAYGAMSSTTQGQLAEIAITSERLVGVNSGGMDQSASIFSRENYLLNVGFVPKLTATLVPFPKRKPGISFVIANSLVVSEKQVTAKYNYNLRVVEMRVAAKMLQNHLKLKLPMPLPTPKDIMDARFNGPLDAEASDYLDQEQKRLQSMLESVEELFGNNRTGVAWGDVYSLLGGIDSQQFKETFNPDFEIEASSLKLYTRIKHAYSEAGRVYRYRKLLEDTTEGDEHLASNLGELMNESQASCRDLYECSCPEIDEICELARSAGSLGSRVSGAGWGGCTVHLVPEDKEGALINTLKRQYYAKRYPDLSDEELVAALFATRPEEGACLYLVS